MKKKNLKIPEDFLPGEARIRRIVEAAGSKDTKKTIVNDANAGLTVAMNTIPDGMACGLLAGVSPVMGLFAGIVGSIIGGIFSSSKLMIISTTSAAAFLLHQLVQVYPESNRVSVLILLVLFSGIIMIIMGFMKLGSMVRFVSHSVMTGFLAGIAILTILSQLQVLFDIQTTGINKVMQTVELFQNISLTNWQALVPGIITIVCMWLLPKTSLGNKSSLVAIAIPSLLIFFLKWESVEIVRDVGDIPKGLPPLKLPDLSIIEPSLLSGAFSLAFITLIQAAGVSQSVSNPDGSRSHVSKDFISQGIANISTGMFGGIGVGGSLGSTSLNILSGARSRWAGIFSGFLCLICVMLLPRLVEHVAMPVLAALMIYTMAKALRIKESKQVWNSGWASRVGLMTAFVATLLFPIQYAVLISILISFTLYFFTSSRLVKLHARKILDDGRFKETALPSEIESKQIHIFAVDGGLHFAGARILEKQWPKLNQDTKHPVIILELPGRNNIGATLTEVIESFYEKVKKAKGLFYITELTDIGYESLRIQTNSEVLRGMYIIKKESIIGESTRNAVGQGREWLSQISADNS